MNKNNRLIWILAPALAMGAVGCDREVYDPEVHENIIHYYSPVDSVDQHHTWQLTATHTYSITANAGVGATKLQVFDRNPVESAAARLMGQSDIRDGETVGLSLSVPLNLTTLYAALVDESGTYTVASFDTKGQRADFSNPLAIKQSRGSSSTLLQTYTYCFEEDYPEPGDYDYNDVVLRVAMERTGLQSIRIQVTLAAVGASKQLAGAIRLVGFRYQDIDSVTTDGGLTFNKDVPQPSHNLLEKEDNLLKGRNNEAVINLFLDAHWATGDRLETNYGFFARKKYNVSNGSSGDYQQIATRTRTYNVYFAKSTGLDGFTLDSLDPFVLVDYNSAKWEIHTDEFVDAKTFYEYNTLSFKDLPWALKVPTADFHYPLEGNDIGMRKKLQDGTVGMSGAYMTVGHSFGEWAEDHTRFLDWYEYPTQNMVWR